MENYKNSVGDIAGGKAGGIKGDGLANLGGAVAGTVISTVIGGLFAKGENDKALKLQKQISDLTLAQQKQLEERLQDVQSETERQGLMYQYLAVQNNNEMLNRIKGKRYTSYIVLGVGVTVLALVFLKLAQRKNG
jgi:outer membrane lipoprotein SlyB